MFYLRGFMITKVRLNDIQNHFSKSNRTNFGSSWSSNETINFEIEKNMINKPCVVRVEHLELCTDHVTRIPANHCLPKVSLSPPLVDRFALCPIRGPRVDPFQICLLSEFPPLSNSHL